jgi:hypothetical protein
MILHIEPIHLIWLCGIGLSLLGGLFAGGRWLLTQLQARTDAQLKLLIDDSARWRAVEREVTNIRVDLSERYVRREDYIRGQTVIEAKLDAINNKVELVQLRGANG